jgi:hypothetical protein
MTSLLKPWVATLTFQAQGVLVAALRGPDGVAKDGPAKAIARALRATLVHNAKQLGPDDVYMGDGTGRCAPEEVDEFFRGLDAFPLHWYHHFVHAAEIVGYLHPNPEIRRFWNAFYERAVEALHLSPESMEAMQQRLRRNGALADAGELGPCTVCGHAELRAGLCANCLTPRMAKSP